jgi:hypothetical protein
VAIEFKKFYKCEFCELPRIPSQYKNHVNLCYYNPKNRHCLTCVKLFDCDFIDKYTCENWEEYKGSDKRINNKRCLFEDKDHVNFKKTK